MTLPSLLFGLLLALLLGALYHFLRGGGVTHLLVYLFMSVLGFVAGHLVGIWREWVFFPLGPLNLGLEAAGGLVFLAFADWLLHLPPRLPEE
jgi:hypothetical protein